MTPLKLCFCNDCLSERDFWFDFDGSAQCVDGCLLHHEFTGPNSSAYTFSCSAFVAELPAGGGNYPRVLVRFVSARNLLSCNNEADGLVAVEYADLTGNPAAILASLVKSGFYISSEGTAEHVADAIRRAVDFIFFEVRIKLHETTLRSDALEGVTIQ